ncbi:MAG: hypothetical protein QOG25_2333 [Acetobacteraceae bacterium]|jgi:hypothetical protein|nr:hypothetical protein [Acetobacteraceae bacterium]
MIPISTGTEAHKPWWPHETRPDRGSDGAMTDGIPLGRWFAGRLNRMLTETAWPPAADIWLQDLVR